MIGIPSEYLAKMGRYSIEIEGVEVKVKVVHIGCASVVNSSIVEMGSALKTRPRVVGVDVKYLKTRDDNHHYASDLDSLALCAGANCLIVHLGFDLFYSLSNDKATPEELMKFLKDTSVCFVGSTRRPSVLAPALLWGVQAGDLAAMVLKKPSLIRSTLAEIAPEAGVHYEGPPNGSSESLKVDMINPIVLTEDQVKLAVNDAYAYYKIGHNLLSSLYCL